MINKLKFIPTTIFILLLFAKCLYGQKILKELDGKTDNITISWHAEKSKKAPILNTNNSEINGAILGLVWKSSLREKSSNEHGYGFTFAIKKDRDSDYLDKSEYPVMNIHINDEQLKMDGIILDREYSENGNVIVQGAFKPTEYIILALIKELLIEEVKFSIPQNTKEHWRKIYSLAKKEIE